MIKMDSRILDGFKVLLKYPQGDRYTNNTKRLLELSIGIVMV